MTLHWTNPQLASETPPHRRLTMIVGGIVTLSLLAMLFVIATWAYAGPENATAALDTEGRWVNHTNVNYIRAMAVEDDQYVWVATDGGVACWDLVSGRCVRRTTANSLGSNDVLSVLVDGRGRKWFGTAVGVSVLNDGGTPLDLTDDTWQHYSRADGLIGARVQAIGVTRGSGHEEYKWLGTERGITVLDDSDPGALRTRSFTAADGMTSNSVTTIAVSNTQEVWCGTPSGVTVFLNGDPWITPTLTTYTIANDLIPSNRIRDIVCEGGEVWIATEAGLSERTADGSWRAYRRGAGLPYPEVVAVSVDGRDNVWLVLGDGRLAVGQRGTGSRLAFSPVEGFAGEATTLAYDGSHYTLAGTRGHGIVALDATGTPTGTYFSAEGPTSNQVTSLSFHNNTLLCGTWGNGASIWDGTDWLHYRHDDGLGSDYVTAVAFDVIGRKWFGSWPAGWADMAGGLSVLTTVTPTWATFTDTLPSPYVFSAALTGTDSVWVGTDRGAVRIDHLDTPLDPLDDITTAFTVSDCLGSDIVYAIAISSTRDGDSVWFGTTGGLSLLRDDGTPSSNYECMTYTIPDGLASNIIYDLAVDEPGSIWVATARGLCRLEYGDPFDKADDRWQTYMAGTWVRSLARDWEGCWWLATWDGVHRLCDGGTPFTTTDDIWATYTVSDGLASNNVYAVAMDPATGHMWLATDHGLSEFVRTQPTPTPTATPTTTGTPTIIATPTATLTGTPPTATPSATPSATPTVYMVYLPVVLKQATLAHSF